MAPAGSPTPGDNPVPTNATISTSPTLATKLPPQAVAKTSSALAIVASSTQAVSSPVRAVCPPVRAVSPPTRAVVSVSTRSGRRCYCNDERSSPAKRFCSGEERLRTRLEIPPHSKPAAPPSRKLLVVVVRLTRLRSFLLLRSPYLPPRTEESVYMPRFRHLLDCHRFSV